MPEFVFNEDDPFDGSTEDAFLGALLAESTAALAAGEALRKEAPRVARSTPSFLLRRRLRNKSPQFVELARAVLAELAEALLAAIAALLAAPPLHQRPPVVIAPAPLPVVRGSPIRTNAPPVQQLRCCRASSF